MLHGSNELLYSWPKSEKTETETSSLLNTSQSAEAYISHNAS